LFLLHKQRRSTANQPHYELRSQKLLMLVTAGHSRSAPVTEIALISDPL